MDRLTVLSWQATGAPTPFASWTYALNSRGQRLSATDATGRKAAYAYDAAALLASEVVTGDPAGASGNGELSYALDAVSNQLSLTSTLAAVPAATYAYDANDQLSSDGYDLNGSTTSSGGHSFGYDFEGHLVTKDGGAVRITYDGDGNRVAKTVGGVTTRYLVDDRNPTGYVQVLEEVGAGGVETVYTYGRRLVSQTRLSGGVPHKSFYGYDGRGNITFLTDGTGAVTDSYDYDAWGNVVARSGTTSNRRLFGGEELDPDLGLVVMRARYYDPARGRFSTVDPARGRIDMPITLNRYLYANGDPVNEMDPTGRNAVLEFFGVLGKNLKDWNKESKKILEKYKKGTSEVLKIAPDNSIAKILHETSETYLEIDKSLDIMYEVKDPPASAGLAALVACEFQLATGDASFPCFTENPFPDWWDKGLDIYKDIKKYW
jgi:RHS repeat-associated protein